MFGLRQQIGGHKCRWRSVVSNNKNFRRAGRAINGQGEAGAGGPDFCRHYVDATRAEKLIDLRHCLGAKGHGGNRLRPADLKDVVYSYQLCGHQHRRWQGPVRRGRNTQHTLRAPRDHSRYPKHQHRRRVGRLASWSIQANLLDRPPEPAGTHSGL
jgi:hypothetical protein